MAEIIDALVRCDRAAKALAAAGVRTVIRYYSRDTSIASKRLTLAEALALTGAGLRIGIVHEARHGDDAQSFDHATGIADAAYAHDYAVATIRQPQGSTIYFGVDFDATAAQIRDRILPFFAGVREGFAKATGGPRYTVGVYGSGATCRAVLKAGLAEHAWLAQSKGWRDFASFAASGDWTLKQGANTVIAGIDCDPNEAQAGKPIGDFTLPAVLAPGAATSGTAMRVIARSGLRLRNAPDPNASSPRSLAYGTIVHPLRTEAGWTLIDLEGDGAADGFVSSAYLADIAAPVVPPVAAPVTTVRHDAARVDALIRCGSTAAGLHAARVAAKAALPGYPTNGCAAHLSALLQQSGIDVRTTLGAGALARVLAARGWIDVERGDQQPGDVGVTYDRDPTPPGADHIYLVIECFGEDEMLIADNQTKEDAPHTRFASGKGKTETEYFLRAT